MASTSSAVGATPSDSISMTCPPIMPGGSLVSRSPKQPTPVPTASDTSRRMATVVAGGGGGGGGGAGSRVWGGGGAAGGWAVGVWGAAGGGGGRWGDGAR